eukprot:4395822-Amphidinium_carterae.1
MATNTSTLESCHWLPSWPRFNFGIFSPLVHQVWKQQQQNDLQGQQGTRVASQLDGSLFLAAISCGAWLLSC